MSTATLNRNVVRVPTTSIWGNYKCQPNYLDFMRSKVKVKGAMGGYRSMKSFHCVLAVLREAKKKNGGRIAVVREDFRDIENSILRTFEDILTGNEGIIARPYHTTDKNIFVRTQDGGTCEIVFIGLKQHSKQSVGSMELSGFYICEASEVAYEVFDILMTRLNRPGFEHFALLDWNPTGKAHWLWKVFGNPENRNPDMEYWQFSTYDNPFLPPDYIPTLERQHKNDPEWLHRYLLGNWGFTGSGTPVYEVFKRSIHVIPGERQDGSVVKVGLDFGFHHPAMIISEERSGGMVVTYSKQYTDRTDAQFAAEVIATVKELYPESLKAGKVSFCGDPAGNQKQAGSGISSITEFQKVGIYIHNPFKGVDGAGNGEAKGINNGCAVVRKKLSSFCSGSTPYLSFLDCLENEFLFEVMDGGYRFPGAGERTEYDQKGDPKPVKDGLYDHLADTLRYLVIYHFGNDGGRDEGAKALDKFFQREAIGMAGAGIFGGTPEMAAIGRILAQ